MTPVIRPATPADAEACGRIIFEAFRAIADQHGFPWDFPSAEAGTQLATTFIAAPSIYGVVAELDGGVSRTKLSLCLNDSPGEQA
jgi:hypothetical protein